MKYEKIIEEKLHKLEQFIRGSILGDGYLTIQKTEKTMSRMQFTHSPKQQEYLKWKGDILNSIGIKLKIRSYTHASSRYKSGYYTNYLGNSESHPVFTEFRKKYYPKGKKILNREDLKNINEFALAIWYMDDGNIWNRKNRSSCITLNTQSFSKDDIFFLIDLLLKKWEIKSTYNKSDNTIRVSSKSCSKLINLIKPYIISEMEYKTKLVHVKLGELLETP